MPVDLPETVYLKILSWMERGKENISRTPNQSQLQFPSLFGIVLFLCFHFFIMTILVYKILQPAENMEPE